MKSVLHDRARARLERERGNPPLAPHAALRFALAFPNEYSVGMASLGFQLVHQLLNDPPRMSCERVFLPDKQEIAHHQRLRLPLFALESLRLIRDFDVLAFSVSYEMDYLNLLTMLQLAGLPLASRDRDQSHPLVIAGGVCATFNPEPLSDFIDAFVVGEAEAALPGLLNALESNPGEPRADLMARLAQTPGVYVPAFYRPRYNATGRLVETAATKPAPDRVVRAIARDLSDFPASSNIRTEEAEFGDITLLEMSRGCGRGCRFCAAGHITGPLRHRSIDTLPGDGRLGLVGAAVFDHPKAADICRSIVDSGREFTVSSIRLETLTPELARLMAAGGQKTLTIAPEAGNRRLRKVIRKDCADEDVLAAAAAAQDAGIRRLKLYFMVGLPTETDSDIGAILDLLRRVSAQFPAIRLQASASVFVPKPWTPFQWSGLERPDALKRRLRELKSGIRGIRGVSLSGESPRLAAVQALLARGDRAMGAVLARALENGGGYAAAARECSVDLEDSLYRERSMDEVFPWDHIDTGVDRDRLWREYRRATAGD